jgi:hypothetical protein
MAMELGDHTLEDRAKYLNMKQVRHTTMGDFISPKDRKSIWIQIVEIVLVLNQDNILS